MARKISNAPPPIEPLPRGTGFRPVGKSDARLKTSPQEILESQVQFDRDSANCRKLIRKWSNLSLTNQSQWDLDGKRWSQLLWPSVVQAATDCKDKGLVAADLTKVFDRLRNLETEWKLVCEARAIPSQQYRTGAPGRPSAQFLVDPEFERRAQANELKPRLIDEAEYLAQWHAANHPASPRLKPQTIANNIRARYIEKSYEIKISWPISYCFSWGRFASTITFEPQRNGKARAKINYDDRLANIQDGARSGRSGIPGQRGSHPASGAQTPNRAKDGTRHHL